MTGGREPNIQQIPAGSEMARHVGRLFERPSETLWSGEGPIPGEQVLPGTYLCVLGKPDGWAEYQYLLAGMAVVRGMVAEQRGLGYRRAKELVNDLLDARTASDEFVAHDRLLSSADLEMAVPARAVELRRSVNSRLHALFDEVVGHLALADRRARNTIPDRVACENLVDELVRVARIPVDELPEVGGDTELDFVRSALVESLVQTPDWQNRAYVAESQLEQAEYSHASLAGQIRELLGLPRDARPSPADLRNRYEDLEGRALAADERRDEMAAYVVQMVDFLRRYRTNDMSSDMEMVHNALLASPRSSDTDKVARACLDREVERRFSARTTEAAAREAALRTEAAAREAALRTECTSLRLAADKSLEIVEGMVRTAGLAASQTTVWRRRCYAALGLALVAVCGLILGR